MDRRQCASVFSLLLCGMFVAGCGGSPRVLQSISISPNPAVAKNGKIQLVATGTFSSAPVTVSPLPVNWYPGNCDNVCNAVNPEVVGPISINSAGLASCVAASGTFAVQAVAPANPDLPLDSQNVRLVQGTASLTCN